MEKKSCGGAGGSRPPSVGQKSVINRRARFLFPVVALKLRSFRHRRRRASKLGAIKFLPE